MKPFVAFGAKGTYHYESYRFCATDDNKCYVRACSRGSEWLFHCKFAGHSIRPYKEQSVDLQLDYCQNHEADVSEKVQIEIGEYFPRKVLFRTESATCYGGRAASINLPVEERYHGSLPVFYCRITTVN